VRQLYKTNPEISAAFRIQEKAFSFAKYVRNVMVGHMDDALLAKSLEWKPDLRWHLLENTESATLLVNLFVLETAMNTYADLDGNHLVFEGDTDLLYPPDWERFVVWLTEILRAGFVSLQTLVAATQSLVPPPPRDQREVEALFTAAGRTEFRRITNAARVLVELWSNTADASVRRMTNPLVGEPGGRALPAGKTLSIPHCRYGRCHRGLEVAHHIDFSRG
jgi:hypothetical protein